MQRGRELDWAGAESSRGSRALLHKTLERTLSPKKLNLKGGFDFYPLHKELSLKMKLKNQA